MLIICNGAIKSGSTWLYNILINIVQCEHPPQKYLTGRSAKSPCIRPDLLSQFIHDEDCERFNFISKNHLSNPKYRTLIQSNSSVFVFDIERDPKDVVVSNYYHDRFRNGYQGDFSSYYWHRGRYVVAELSSYHNIWRDAGPRSYVSSYQRLHADFAAEARSIASVLGSTLTDEAVSLIREKTSLSTLRAEYKEDNRYRGDKFFRKGEVGDWKNHLDAAMLKDLENIVSSGLSKYDLRKNIAIVRKKLGFTF